MTLKLPINFDSLLHQRTVEGERVEYKKGWNPEAVLPRLESDDDRTYFLIRLPVHSDFETKATPQAKGEVKQLLEMLQGEMSRSDLMEAIGLSDKKYFREKYLQPAMDLGLIEMTIPDKPNSPLQKYRRTNKPV